MNTAFDWWSSPENGKEWISNWNKKAGRSLDYSIMPKIILSDVKRIVPEVKSICEVGSGVGCNIGLIKNELPSVECYAVDINKELLESVKKYNQDIICTLAPAHRLPFDDNSFDLVFTQQMLQHVDPEHIEASIKELLRVTKKELWCYEGIGRVDYSHGAKSHHAHNGSWVWHIDKMVNCYEMAVPEVDGYRLERLRVYRIKK